MMDKRLIIGQINVMAILGWVFNERKIDILLLQEHPLALMQLEWSFLGYRIYVALGPNPLIAVMVQVSLESSAVDLDGNRVCRVVSSINLANCRFSWPIFDISWVSAWTNSPLGWNLLLQHCAFVLGAWTPMGICLYRVPMQCNWTKWVGWLRKLWHLATFFY